MDNPAITPPQQTRSQRTMNNILKAAAVLLDEKDFDELTINEIVSQAKCSVGAFYGRFKDKEALLHALDERYVAAYLKVGQTFIDRGFRTDQSLQETIRELIELVMRLFEIEQGLMRTLVLRARTSTDPRFREREARINQLIPPVAAILLHHRAEITHPKPELAVQFALFQMSALVREFTIWPHIAATNPASGEALITELTRTLMGYLQGGAS